MPAVPVDKISMLLAQLPIPILILLLAVLGATVGAAINWAVYSWCYFSHRPISPWMKCDDPPIVRTSFDRIPILGWFALNRHSKIFGTGFWIRPLFIELAWAIGLPWFWFWQMGGGLTEPLVAAASWNETWFWAHSLLIGLMFVATFIDFDEKMIPDEVTVSGTLLGLTIASAAPGFRLPEVVNQLAGPVIQPIHFASSNELPIWHHTNTGVLLGLGIFAVWIFALLPARYTFRYGLVKGIRILFSSMLRPRRKTQCELRTTARRPHGVTKLLLVIWAVGTALILTGWLLLPPVHWTSLFGSLVGLAFAGGLVWTIRIVASYAMQQEAMGFGDVTLMAMIGTFLGWQASLLVFAIAPFAALVVVVVQFFLTRENEMAFGPYLCIGALVLLFNWSSIWSEAGIGIFFMGPWLLVILLAGLVLMAAMLVGLQWIKRM